MISLTLKDETGASNVIVLQKTYAAFRKAKEHLPVLLKRWKPAKRLLSVSRMGWADEDYKSFVAGPSIIGSEEVLSPAVNRNAGLAVCGTVEDWKLNVGLKCQSNPLMILAVSLALSGPLLAPLGMSSGGLHFRGASSSGKTTLLTLAASVWGGHQLITQWRATANGLEAVASPCRSSFPPTSIRCPM